MILIILLLVLLIGGLLAWVLSAASKILSQTKDPYTREDELKSLSSLIEKTWERHLRRFDETETKDKVIMCDKVFHENKNLSEKELINQLQNLFEVDKLFFVPWDINDFTGHADGMVRFIDNDTVLINDYSKENAEFQRCFRMSLHNAGLEYIELPYNPPKAPTLISARGLYLNYLQMKQGIIVPTFKTKYDDQALRVLEQVFKGQTIRTVESKDLADEGGILNCITWNIQE